MHRLAVRQVSVHGVRDEGDERRHQLADRAQRLVERLVGGQLVAVRLRLPEPAAGAPDVPVRKVVDEPVDPARGLVGVIAVEPACHRVHKTAQLGQQPPVEHVALCNRDCGPRRIESVEPRVRDEERVAVPQRNEELLHRLAQGLCARAVVLAHLRGRVEVPAHGVRAEVVEEEVRVQHVAARLGRLLALGVDHEAQADDVAVGVLFEEQSRDGQQRVEPAARLVHRL